MMSDNIENVDILVIGAGPSGCVAASIANQKGLKVKVVERSIFPRFVIGESLLPKCMEHLEEAGFMEVLKAQNYQKKFGARFIRGDKDCLFDFSEQFTEGCRTWTWQVPRSHFDQVLATEVQKMGVDVSFGQSVTAVEFDGSNSTTTMVDKEGNSSQVKARYIIDSSGYGRVLPRLLDLEKKTDQPARKAIFTHLTDKQRPEGAPGQQITFVIHKLDVWMWIIPFSDGVTSIGFVGNTDYIESFKGTTDERINQMIKDVPQMRERFQTQDIVVPAKQIEAFAVSAKQLYGDGFVITGNSSEFIDPIFSSGVTFATHSGLLAAKAAVRQLSGEQVDWEKEYSEPILHGVDTFSTYVKTWYDGSLQEIFFYTSETEKIPSNVTMKKQICSVLAGYVWDNSNPFVRKHAKAVKSLSRVIQMQ